MTPIRSAARAKWVVSAGLGAAMFFGGLALPVRANAESPTNPDALVRQVVAAHEEAARAGVFGASSTGEAPTFEAASSGISDPIGDVAYAPADITTASINAGTTQVSMTLTTAVYSDPFTSADWSNLTTGMVWYLDINNDFQPDRYLVEYKTGGSVVARLYDYNTDNFLCSGTPGLDPGNRTYSASVPLSCLGGTDLPSVNWAAYAVIKRPSGVVYVDGAPNSGLSGPVASDGYRPKVAGGTSYTLAVTGRAGVPASGVAAVSLNVTVTAPNGNGYITAYSCGTLPNASNVNYVAGQTVPNAVIAPVDGSGNVCLFTSSTTHLIVDVNGWFPVSSDFQAFSPARLIDTRSGIGTPAGKRPGGSVLTTHVAGFAGVPSTGTGAVVLNVTATSATSDGYITVYPCGSLPNSSNVNFSASTTVPNLVIAPLSASGDVCLFTSATTDLIVDVAGSFPVSATGFQPLVPQRRYDSRSGARLGAGGVLTLSLGSGGIPASGVAAVSINVTSTNSTAGGFITVYPCGAVPNASSVNFAAGVTTANAVITPVTAGSQVCITTSAETHLLVDVNGWFPTSATGFQPVAPARVLDTR